MRAARHAHVVVMLVALASGTLAAQVTPPAPPAQAQAQAPAPGPGPLPAQVVQIAGANLYIDAGTDAGVRTGDTLTVRRSPTAAPVGSAVVIGATRARSIITFVGAAFPVTRGDTLFITPGNTAAAAVVAAQVAATQPRAPPRVVPRPDVAGGTRVDGALALEMWGSHSEVTGLGADPMRTTRDVGIPSVRLRSRVVNGSSAFDLNLRAEHRTGPPTVFDRATRIRVYEARYDRTAGALAFSAGRFFSDFDHASGFWDGASLRVGDQRGFSGGVAAGFEPLRGNEEFSTEVPKAAAFVGTRVGTERVDLATDLAYHQTFAKDFARQRQAVDWSLRLRTGRWALAQELEASPPTRLGTWGISRFILRGSASVGRAELYGSAVSDRPIVFDTAWTLPLDRRERVSTGMSYQSPNGLYWDVNAAINGPRDSTSGYSTGAMISLPALLPGGTVAVSGSWFTSNGVSGITASPSVEYRLGSARLRGGYQLFRVDAPAYSVTTHGVDFRLSQSLSRRLNWIVQLNGRTGGNIRSTTVYSSFEMRF